MTTLAERMEAREAEQTRRAKPGEVVYVRLDGRNFSRWTRGLEKPFCAELADTMDETTKALVEESGAILGYTQSDEITLILARIFPDGGGPTWLEGDARECHRISRDFDGLLTCPPYGDLEVYSDDPRDLSAMDEASFVREYRVAIASAVKRVRQDRFLCIVVGDYRRRKGGTLAGFPALTFAAFLENGCHLYNEMVFLTPCGSLPIRIGKQFKAGRKVGKTHQNVLVFVKGDGKKTAAVIRDAEREVGAV